MSEPILSGRYKIVRKLGEGGFGQTFLATDLHLPTKPFCVVKRLKAQFSDAESAVLAHRLFEQEAETMYRLGSHPNIPNLLAHFESEGEFFLAQEYIEGATLTQEFESGKIYSEVEAVRFLGELLDTLSYVHQQNVIHRDIKPSNLIHRVADGKLFLIDFGAVKQVSVNPFNQNPTFKSTVAIGTSGYAPSEQTIGKPRFASDIYAAGLVTIQALTGMNPLKLKNNEVTGEFIWQHKTNLNQEFTDFITKLTRYDFRQRYNSATEASFALNMIATKIGVRIKSNQTGTPMLNPVKTNLPKFDAPNNPNQLQIGNNTPQFIPPTIVSPQSNSQLSDMTLTRNSQNFAAPSRLTLQPPTLHERQNQKTPDVPKGFGGMLRTNDFALSIFVAVIVLGLFFIGGYVLVSNLGSSDEQVLTADTPVADMPEDSTPNAAFQQAEYIAAQTDKEQKNAKTKAEWQQIANNYKHAADVLALIEPNDPYYQRAQTRILEFQAHAKSAAKNAEIAIDNISMPTSNPTTTTYTPIKENSSPYSTSPGSTSSYSTPLPAKPQIAAMPPPRKEKMYISFNRSPYDARGSVVSKVVTATEGDFTSSIGNSGAYSGSVTIRVNGGPDSCDVTFIAPHSERLQPGTYSGAQRYPFQSPTKPGLDFSGTGGCNTVAGSFTINDILYGSDGKSIVMLYATFIHRCGETAPPTMGRVHYDARY